MAPGYHQTVRQSDSQTDRQTVVFSLSMGGCDMEAFGDALRESAALLRGFGRSGHDH